MDSASMNQFPPPRPLPSDLTLTLTLPTSPPPPPTTQHHGNNHDLVLEMGRQTMKPEERGVRLIQLLVACAAHTSSANLHRAEPCLRLISTLSSPSGDSMQRLASLLAASLAVRLLRLRWPGLLSALLPRPTSTTAAEKAARLAFARALPYLAFSRAVVGRTLLRALAHERFVHVISLGCQRDPDLWTPLLRGFSLLPRGPPHLRITCVDPDTGALDSLGSSLVKEAEYLHVPFRFDPVNLPFGELDSGMLKVKSGEALAVVSVLSLHELLAEESDSDADETDAAVDHHRRKIDRFLSMVRSMLPKVVVVVEQEADHNSSKMADRFVEGLHYYSALFDSVDSASGRALLTPDERLAVEEMLGREIENMVACEGGDRVERHERATRWAGRFGRAGFRQVRLWHDVLDEAKRVLDSYHPNGGGGYRVITESGCPVICWHDWPMYAVSAWQCLNENYI